MRIISIFLFFISWKVIFGQTINTFAGSGTPGYSGDGGLATAAQLNYPGAVAIDANCNIYISDYANGCIRKINNSGVITTIAGIGVPGYSGDGGPATSAQVCCPQHIALDAAGNIYFCESWAHRVRKISTLGIITTIAGTGTQGFSGDGGLAINATLYLPRGIVIDKTNNIYISDCFNSKIRKIDTSGIITTFAGTTFGYSGDGGPATSAQMNSPTGMAFDSFGNLYIADYYGHTIRKINTSGIITTVAGTGSGGFSGDGGTATLAQLAFPMDLSVDATGNLFIADEWNHRIRVVNTSGVINTFAGTGLPGFSGDGGPAILAQMHKPSGIKIDPAGNFYIPDSLNHRIRIIGSNTCFSRINTINSTRKISVYPNPALNFIKIELDESAQYNAIIEITNTIGQTVYRNSFQKEIDISQLENGIYFLSIINQNNESINEELIINK